MPFPYHGTLATVDIRRAAHSFASSESTSAPLSVGEISVAKALLPLGTRTSGRRISSAAVVGPIVQSGSRRMLMRTYRVSDVVSPYGIDGPTLAVSSEHLAFASTSRRLRCVVARAVRSAGHPASSSFLFTRISHLLLDVVVLSNVSTMTATMHAEQWPNKGGQVIRVAIAMSVISMLSTIWRLVVRFRVSPWMGFSDWLMLAGSVGTQCATHQYTFQA